MGLSNRRRVAGSCLRSDLPAAFRTGLSKIPPFPP